MATPRLRSTWFRHGAPRAPEQLASAAAAIGWRTANHRIARLRSVGFAVDAGEPYVRVQVELLCFLIALAAALPEQYDRRWGADQAMSVDGPAAAEAVAGATAGLLGRAAKSRRSRTVEA